MLVHAPKLTLNVFPNPNIELSQQYQSNGDDQSQNESYGTVGKVGASVKSTCLDVDRRKKTPGGSSGDLWLGRCRNQDECYTGEVGFTNIVQQTLRWHRTISPIRFVFIKYCLTFEFPSGRVRIRRSHRLSYSTLQRRNYRLQLYNTNVTLIIQDSRGITSGH